MSKKSKMVYFFTSLIFFIVSDLYFSDLILKYGYKLIENPFFELTFVQNQGAAFNILEGSKYFLIIFSLAALAGIIFYIIKNIKHVSLFGIMSTAVLCAGIFCNTLERITFGYVRDFIKLNFIDFPIFNISDIYISISVFVIVIIIIKNNYIKK